VTGNYDAPFHVSGTMLLAGGLLCCVLHLPYFQLRALTATPAGKDDDAGHGGEVEGSSLTAAAVASPSAAAASGSAGQPSQPSATSAETGIVTTAEGRRLVVSMSSRSVTGDVNAV
jgi:hypothetical protein